MTPGSISFTASAQGLTGSTISIKTIDDAGTSTAIRPVSSSGQKTGSWIRMVHCGKNVMITVPENVRHDVSIVRADGACVKKFSANAAAIHFWNTSSVGHGVYFIYARSDRNIMTKKVTVIR